MPVETGSRVGQLLTDPLAIELLAVVRRAALLPEFDYAFRFRDFESRAARLAGCFAAHGVGAGSKVAMYLFNCNEYLETCFAAMKLCAVPVNVNFRYLEDELHYLIGDFDPIGIETGSSYLITNISQDIACVAPDVLIFMLQQFDECRNCANSLAG